MKNACLLIKTEGNALCFSKADAATQACLASGLTLDELRVIYAPLAATQAYFVELLQAVKAGFDNVVLIVETALLTTLKASVLSVFPTASLVGAGGEGVFTSTTDKKTEKTLFLFPEKNIENTLQPFCSAYLSQKSGIKTDSLFIRAMGASEARVQSLLAQAKQMDGGKMRYLHTRSFDEDILQISYDQTVPKMLLDDVLRLFADGLDESVYALENVSLERRLVQLLKLRGKKISVAESFTGGGIAKKIVSVPGASEVYFEGLNTYNELSKIKRLGVSEYTLKTVGAVSDQTAYEMAAGLIATGDADISIATTGLAGPKSDNSMLPVGLCYIAVGTKERVFVYRYKFEGEREEITQKAISYALFHAYKHLKNM